MTRGQIMRRLWGSVLAATLTLAFSLAVLAEQKIAVGSSAADISLHLVKETNGKPVKYATIVLHSLDKEGKQTPGGINLKSDGEGKAEFRGLPYGKLRIQVIAKGFQTFGEDFEINKPTHEFMIKMQPPKDQYSIYK
jgi:hypothetical protein